MQVNWPSLQYRNACHRQRPAGLSVYNACAAASVGQMLAGSLIVFSAVLSSVFLKRTLNRWHDAGCGWT